MVERPVNSLRFGTPPLLLQLRLNVFYKSLMGVQCQCKPCGFERYFKNIPRIRYLKKKLPVTVGKHWAARLFHTRSNLFDFGRTKSISLQKIWQLAVVAARTCLVSTLSAMAQLPVLRWVCIFYSNKILRSKQKSQNIVH